MSALIRLTCFAIALLIASGCGRKEQPKPPSTAEDLRAARKAMTISEVSLMVRSGYKEHAIIPEVTRRHVSEKPDAKTEATLLQLGATPALIQALKMDANVLTESQKKAYDYLAAERARPAAQERVTEEGEDAPAELPVEKDVVEQTRQNLRNAETYKAQEQSLEIRIATQEAFIRRLRANGYTESQLLHHNETLDSYRQQLRDLKLPLR